MIQETLILTAPENRVPLQVKVFNEPFLKFSAAIYTDANFTNQVNLVRDTPCELRFALAEFVSKLEPDDVRFVVERIRYFTMIFSGEECFKREVSGEDLLIFSEEIRKISILFKYQN